MFFKKDFFSQIFDKISRQLFLSATIYGSMQILFKSKNTKREGSKVIRGEILEVECGLINVRSENKATANPNYSSEKKTRM